MRILAAALLVMMIVNFANAAELGIAYPYTELNAGTDAQITTRFAEMKEVGAKHIRFDFYWGNIQPAKNGSYNWARTDLLVQKASDHGMYVIGILNGFTGYVSQGLTTQADRDLFANFAAAAVARYKGKIKHWEILNEPNMDMSFIKVTAANYASLLKTTYPKMKAADSSITVLFAGISAVPADTAQGHQSAVNFVTTVYQQGGKAFFDAMNIHPYTYPVLPTRTEGWTGIGVMRSVRQIMEQNGDSAKKIWLTEFGAPTAGGGNQVSEAVQEQHLREVVKIVDGLSWAGPISWYSMKDRGVNANSTEDWFGLLRPDNSKKPAYAAFKALAGSTVVTPPACPACPTCPSLAPLEAKVKELEAKLATAGTEAVTAYKQQQAQKYIDEQTARAKANADIWFK